MTKMREAASNKLADTPANKLETAIPPCPPGFDDDGLWLLVRSRTGIVTGWFHHQTHGFKELPAPARADPIANVPKVKAARANLDEVNRRIDETRETWLAAGLTLADLNLLDARDPELWTADHQPIYTATKQARDQQRFAAADKERSTRIAYDNECSSYAKAKIHLHRTEAQARRDRLGD